MKKSIVSIISLVMAFVLFFILSSFICNIGNIGIPENLFMIYMIFITLIFICIIISAICAKNIYIQMIMFAVFLVYNSFMVYSCVCSHGLDEFTSDAQLLIRHPCVPTTLVFNLGFFFMAFYFVTFCIFLIIRKNIENDIKDKKNDNSILTIVFGIITFIYTLLFSSIYFGSCFRLTGMSGVESLLVYLIERVITFAVLSIPCIGFIRFYMRGNNSKRKVFSIFLVIVFLLILFIAFDICYGVYVSVTKSPWAIK